MLYPSELIFKMGRVHGHLEFVAVDPEGNPYLIERGKKNKIVFTPTIMEESRLKKFRLITLPELIILLKEGELALSPS